MPDHLPGWNLQDFCRPPRATRQRTAQTLQATLLQLRPKIWNGRGFVRKSASIGWRSGQPRSPNFHTPKIIPAVIAAVPTKNPNITAASHSECFTAEKASGIHRSATTDRMMIAVLTTAICQNFIRHLSTAVGGLFHYSHCNHTGRSLWAIPILRPRVQQTRGARWSRRDGVRGRGRRR